MKKGVDFVKANAPNTYLDLGEGKGAFQFYKLSRKIIGRLDVRPISIFI